MSSLDINGYNATFRAFTDFAAQQIDAGKNKAIARVVGDGPLANRTITAAKHDWVGIGRGRLWSLKDANNTTRELFRKAIGEMFGDERNIPESVKDAMKLEDYGKGKPLTARRILAVKTAIDADKSISTFQNEATAKTALAKGYSQAELPRLAKAVNLLARAEGCSEAEALEEVTTPGSKANRLMKYGGRFLQSEDNFKNGLRLLDSFSNWFDKTCAELKDIHKSSLKSEFKEGMSRTLLNGMTATFKTECKGPIERFVFEELAHDPSANLAETDADKLFGLENNQAMGCIGRDFQKARTQTFAQIPPEKRTTFFKALNVLCPLYASTADQAKVHPSERNVLVSKHLDVPVARILKNLDKLIELERNGKLDQASLVKLCFPEIKRPGANPASEVLNLIEQWGDDIDYGQLGTGKYPPKNAKAMIEAMKATGCSIKEAFQIAKGEKQLENVPYFSSGTLELHKFGEMEGARKDLGGQFGDLTRPDNNYHYTGGPLFLTGTQVGFRFNFPGGESLLTNGTAEGREKIPTIMDKLEELCGPAHKEQASALLMMTSQSGLANLKNALEPHSIASNEHSPIDFTISKDATTGDISIRYSSPKDLPFSFEWTATIKPDGYVSTTPFRFTDEATLKKEMADTTDVLKAQLIMPSYTPEQVAAANEAIEMIVSTAKGDRDLLALLRMDNGQVAKGFAHDVSNHIRPLDDIARRLERVRSNLNELRTAAKGDQRLFNIGLRHLVLFNGGALKSGTITKLCELAAKEDVGKFKGLSKSSPPEKIFAAMCELDRIVNKICKESRILENFSEGGGDEAAGVNSFIVGLLFARCDEKSLSGFKQAMFSDNGQQMYSAMQQLNDGDFPRGYEISSQTANVIQHRVARSLGLPFHQATWTTLNTALGHPADYDSRNFSRRPVDDASFRAITDLIVRHVEDVYESKLYDEEIHP